MTSVLIAGAGIGGLTAAMTLHRIGVKAEVFESAPEIRALGVGINLQPNAVRVLTELGLDDELAATGIPTAELAYYTKRGQAIWNEPRGRAAGFNWPQYSIHRGRLQMMLLEAARARLGADAIHTGHELTSFETSENGVRARFGDREITGSMLIGADGIHSAVRRAFYPEEGAPRFSGRMLWRGVTEADPYLTGRTMIMAGNADHKFVCYPICQETAQRGRALVNWIAELLVGEDQLPPKRDWNRRIDRATFAPAFDAWNFGWLDVPALIAQAAEVFEFPMVDRDPLSAWTFGMTTLLGDAAHPMYPIGSNGASQAILDADALALSVARCGISPLALSEYEAQRRPATSAMVYSNRQMGQEVVMQIVEDRAPEGFTHLDHVISPQELAGIVRSYRAVAGFDPDLVNRIGIPPALTLAFRATVRVAEAQVLNDTQRVVPISGGTFAGPAIQGAVLAGGADHQTVRPDGVLEIDARYELETHDGVRIEVVNRGLRHGPPEVLARLMAGEAVPPGEYYFRATPIFRAPAGPYEWLNRAVFVCNGERLKGRVALTFWRVE